MSDISEALRKVAGRLAVRPWTTGVEDAFLELARELEMQGDDENAR